MRPTRAETVRRLTGLRCKEPSNGATEQSSKALKHPSASEAQGSGGSGAQKAQQGAPVVPSAKAVKAEIVKAGAPRGQEAKSSEQRGVHPRGLGRHTAYQPIAIRGASAAQGVHGSSASGRHTAAPCGACGACGETCLALRGRRFSLTTRLVCSSISNFSYSQLAFQLTKDGSEFDCLRYSWLRP